jgi:UDP-sugar transporter A1/2/3
MNTVGPLAIVGGTVSIYTAALSHSSTTLTPLSVLYLFLLALNYSIMPRISKKYVSPKTNKESVALVEEVVKMSMGIGGFLLTECSMNSNGGMSMHNLMTSVQEATSNWSIHSSLLAAGLPSALYAIQGVLTYTSYQNLDSVTFNGITQIKTLSAALCCYLVLGKVQSKIQILALALLSLSTLVFQGMLDIRWYVNGKEKRAQRKQLELDRNKEGSRSGGVGTSIGGGIDVKKRFIFGIVPCLAATLLSGLAGAFSQRSLQTVVGSMERNAYFYSAEISFISAVCLLFSMATKRIIALRSRFSSSPSSMKSKSASVEVTKVTKSGYFDHWTWQTFVPIIVKATGGILTALVHKHSGSVMKGFSLVLGLVFSALLQTVLDGKDLTLGQIVGTALVLLSSWLHFTNPSS